MDSASKKKTATILDELALFFQSHPADTYLLATSGGKDSMLLCELLRLLALPIEIMHVNYKLRAEQSELDQALVEAYCLKHKLKLHLYQFDLGAYLQSENANLQAKARAIRYEFFREIQAKTPNSLICTAHHADDQLETFWLQLSRGAGLKGLAGMPSAHGNLLRPLLPYRQHTLQKLALELGLVWREDLSNQSLKYRRNLWRLELLPFLRKQASTIDQSVTLLQKQFTFEIEAQENLLQKAISHLKNKSSIELNKIAQLTSYQIVEIFKYLDAPTHVIRRIGDLFSAENGKFLSWRAASSGRLFYLVRQKETIAFFDDTVLEWAFEWREPDVKSNDPSFVSPPIFIDLEKLDGDLYFRKVQDGDRIRIKGMKGSKKALQIFKEMGFPAPLRKIQFVLCDQQKVIAIPPIYINAIVEAQENSKDVAQLLFSKKP
jgi:tRNA(Ile)-lysidine synthase